MVSKNHIKLDKKDCFRFLLSDSIPGDIPIIFSNDGFYTHMRDHKNHYNKNDFMHILINNFIVYEKCHLVEEEKQRNQNQKSTPFIYKILKNNNSLRSISLIHPRAQLNFAKFYHEYASVINYLCEVSSYSIRAPIKVASSVYRVEKDKTRKYKEILIDIVEDELENKYASSFFTYKGVKKIHEFFSSKKFYFYEKKFEYLGLFDISNCFESIYTHTVAWAIKSEDYIIDNIDSKNQFCAKVDTLMQRSNNNKTNGIPIGSEISRIFAEIILQDLDQKIKLLLSSKYSYKEDLDYNIFRYVDDYIVFGKEKSVICRVENLIDDVISQYNLKLNRNKSKIYSRPFYTEKTAITNKINKEIKKLEDKVYEVKIENGGRLYEVRNDFKKEYLFNFFVNEIKSLHSIFNSKNGYADSASYIIGALSKKILNITLVPKPQKEPHPTKNYEYSVYKAIS